MTKNLICILLTFALLSSAIAQERIEFTADRPGASTGPTVVGHNVIQLEQGLQYDGEGGLGVFTFSNTLIRYGILNNMELRLGGDGFIYAHEGSKKFLPAFSGISLGTKIKCYEGKGLIPAVSVLADFAIPCTASNGFGVDYLAPSLYILCENPISKWLSIGYNVGAEWDGCNLSPSAFVAVCLGFSAMENLGCFVESYNYFNNEFGNIYAIDFGLNCMVSPRVQLDLAANLDLRNPSNSWSISCGVAWQINK